MPKHNQQIGQRGEALAVAFLQQHHYQILARNFRTKYAEIDIIAQKDSEIIFFEVKARTTNLYGRPSEVVSTAKLCRIEQCAWHYLRQTNQEHASWSIKVIEVLHDHCAIIETVL